MSANASQILHPGRRWMWANLLLTQAAWFAVVLSAAHGRPIWGGLAAVAVVAWHLCLSARPQAEATLIAAVALVGTLADALVLQRGAIAYASGQWLAAWPPAWMTALWAVFATSLNVTLRWLQGRPLLAAALGAIGGPLAFASGARLGAAHLLEPAPALALLSLEWALMLPVVCTLARRWDGVRPPPVAASPPLR